MNPAAWLINRAAEIAERTLDRPQRLTGITGIDVSKHQGPIDWRKVITEVDFAYIKATEGFGHTDERFESNVLNAHAARVRVGAYHFCRIDTGTDPEKDAEREVDYFLGAILPLWNQLSLPPALDVELGGIKDTRAPYVQQWVRAAVWTVRHRTGRDPVIYTGRSTWRYKLGKTLEFNDLPLWIADYSNGKKPKREIPGWRTMIWQHTAKGSAPGIKGRVDMNRWMGTRAEFDTFCRTGEEAANGIA